jgi:hypothetical protein
MAKAHDRIVELSITPNAGADTIAITAVKYYRDRAQLAASNGFSLAFSGGSAATTGVECALGETLPPPTHIRLVFPTF